jgi:long-chain acyl-CoA synthetase
VGVGLADLVRRAARARPQHPAILAGGGTTTWAQLDASVDAAAAGLQRLGLEPGDRVALLLGNCAEFVSAYFGVLRAGFVAVPVNPAYTSVELADVLASSGARVVVFDRAGAAAARAVSVPGLVRVVVGAPAGDEKAFAGFSGTPRPANISPDDLAVLLFTSGTTGRPRGAMLSHRSMLASVEQVAVLDDPPAMTEDDVALIVLPLSHIYALNGTLAAATRAAATVVLADRFDPAVTADMVRRYRVTNIAGAPSLYAAWTRYAERNPAAFREAFGTIRLLFTGSAAMPPGTLTRFMDATGLSIFEGYGLTEAAPGVASTLVIGSPKPGSVGRPFPGVDVLLVDPDGEEVEDGDPGEILVRGPNLFTGYWPDGSGGPDRDGWFATGDVAYSDEAGDLVLVDRRKELIIVSGFNVYPREVEAALLTHPDVAEAAVIGMPDPDTGEAVKAFVVGMPGVAVDPEDLVHHAGTRLARFKWPSQVEVVDRLPRVASGKVAKGRLRNSAPDGAPPGGAEPTELPESAEPTELPGPL